MKIHIPAFGGIAPALNPRDLPEGGAQEAVNIEAFGESIQPLRGLSATPEASFGNTNIQTIYRYGETLSSTPADWKWWGWSKPDVHIARTQIAGDATEWTFWTGEVIGAVDRMRCTYNYSPTMKVTDQERRPLISFAMNLPAPSLPIIADSKAPRAVLKITGVSSLFTQLANAQVAGGWVLEVGDFVGYSFWSAGLDTTGTLLPEELRLTNWGFTVSGTGPKANCITCLAEEPLVTKDLLINALFRMPTLIADPASDDNTPAFYDAETDTITVCTVARGSEARIRLTFGALNPVVTNADLGISLPEELESWTRRQVQAVIDSWSCEDLYARFRPLRTWSAEGPQGLVETRVYTYTRVYRSTTGYEIESAPAPIGPQSSVDVYPAELGMETASGMQPVWLWEFYPKDVPAHLPSDDFWNAAINGFENQLISSGVSGGGRILLGTFLVRIYRATAGEYLLVDELTYTTDGTLQGRSNTAGEVIVLRATDGTTPLLRTGGGYSPAEWSMPVYNYVDRKGAAELGSVLPSLTWTAPPEGMRGLINLPNGVMAGFKGRDVYFSDPYRPHAWPVQYVQTLDDPIVALSRLDTTLVALTTGAPYFIQGSHPEVMTVVRGQVAQACVSARSVVAMSGVILYASPDGLVSISPNGTSVVTAQIMRADQWLTRYAPAEIMAFQHESQYVAFSGFRNGFIFDAPTQRFVDHSYKGYKAGYTSLRDGQLYIASSTGQTLNVKAWLKSLQTGVSYEGAWTSKVYALPFDTSFAWAQVEATYYSAGMRLQIYVDDKPLLNENGQLLTTERIQSGKLLTDTVGVDYARIGWRQPFRLPPVVGREFYVRVTGMKREGDAPEMALLSITLAQSAAELRAT